MADDTGGIVRSRDGARIAFEWTGQGPPIVLIDTVARFRTCSSLTPLVDLLAPDFTVIQYDRRGRGASTSRRRYRAQCEVEDLAALITAVGGGAHLFGFRSGGLLALQAAAAGLHLSRMVTVDPPALMFSWDSTILAALCETNARDGRSRRRRDAALERMLLSDGASPDEIARDPRDRGVVGDAVRWSHLRPGLRAAHNHGSFLPRLGHRADAHSRHDAGRPDWPASRPSGHIVHPPPARGD